MELANLFFQHPHEAWNRFLDLPDWKSREEVVEELRSRKDDCGYSFFAQRYRHIMEPYIREEFYDGILSNEDVMQELKNKYQFEGNIEVQFLKTSSLEELSSWAESIEHKGNKRFGKPRFVYPPGEASQFKEEDPRKALKSDVNMVAISSRMMEADDKLQWIYHSPDLQQFIKRIMQYDDIYPYNNCDIGLAMNICRPVVTKENVQTEVSLGFHFDSINSSPAATNSTKFVQARGATGVIGIKDCELGGERIVFSNVSREQVDNVTAIVKSFSSHPDNIHSTIHNCNPLVVDEPIAGVLCLFNGGNQLHAVSKVRQGVRIAAVFLYCEENPDKANANNQGVLMDSANSFYGITATS